MHTLTIRLSSLALAGVSLLSPMVGQDPIKICPLGDSIIESYDGRASARYYLDQHLRAGGYAFDFVGHNYGVFGGTPLYPNFDWNHECYSGWQVNHILLDLEMWVQETRPDIVLIHLGTNDIIRSQSATSTVAELGQCVDILRAVNPNVTVMISQIIPMFGRAVEPVNALIPGMVATKDSPTSRVIVVDHYSPFNMTLHMLPDGLHPNDLGEQLMGQVWFDALKDFMTPQAQELQRFGAGCSGTAPMVPQFERIRGQAASLGNPFTVKFQNVPETAISFGILGFDGASYYGAPLPIPLDVLGATGCSMWVGPDITMPMSNLGGTAVWTLNVPENPVLIGGSIFQQAGFLDGSLNALGMIFSDAAHVRIVEGS